MPHVQSCISATTPNSLTASASFSAPVGIGSAVVGAVIFSNVFSGTITVSDDQGNSYLSALSYTTQTITTGLVKEFGFAVFWRGNIRNSPQTITITMSPSAPALKVMASEFNSALGVTDVHDAVSTAGIVVTAGQVYTPPAMTLGGVNEDLFFAAGNADGGTITTSTAGVTQQVTDTTDYTGTIFTASQIPAGTALTPALTFQSAGLAVVMPLALKSQANGAGTRFQLQAKATMNPISIRMSGSVTCQLQAPAQFSFLGTAAQIYST
jgi:hypothetical protein